MQKLNSLDVTVYPEFNFRQEEDKELFPGQGYFKLSFYTYLRFMWGDTWYLEYIPYKCYVRSDFSKLELIEWQKKFHKEVWNNLYLHEGPFNEAVFSDGTSPFYIDEDQRHEKERLTEIIKNNNY